MSFFEDASIVLIPSGIKNQKIYSVKPTDGTGDLTFSRASSATRVQSDGLIEKVRTNLFEYSNTFSNAYWTTPQASVVSGQPDPSGGSTAFKLVEDTSTNFHWLLKSGPLSSAGEWGLSIFAKPAGRNFIAIGNASLGELAYFNLLNGTIVSSHANAVGKIEAAGNGFYRCSVTLLTSGASATGFFISTDGSTTSYTGDGTSGLIIFGAQLETGVTTDYIATTTAAVSVGPVSGLPRLDYLGSTCPRLLLEPQRTNLATYSEQFNHPDWSKAETTITANNAVSPDGYTNADKVEATNTIGNYVNQSTSNVGAYTHSVYAKAGNVSSFTILWASYSSGKAATFNLSTETATPVGATITATITNVGNGWYRCTTTDTSANYIVLISLNNATNTAISIGSYIYLWGAQAELGAYATSYIPTLGASVTRVADAASKTSASALIGQTEGTIFWEFAVDVSAAAGHESIINIDNGSFGNTIYIIKSTAGTIGAEMYVGGVAQASYTSSVQAAGTHKAAIGYANNNTAFFLNGVQIGTTDTSCSVPATSRIQLGSSVFGSSTDKTAQALLFKTRLTNAQLAELTA
jgi:hypothetical protein